MVAATLGVVVLSKTLYFAVFRHHSYFILLQCQQMPLIRYNTRCYYNMRSKAYICKLNLPQETKKNYRRVTNIRISAHFTHLRKFRNFVFATEVTIFSDHNPLMCLRECAPKSAKLTRWALGLQEFMNADSNIFHTSVKV